ncbi:hypothetical protein TcasGA2_TC001870 [Tribolium castaneum]|uniref:Uncharacterized protein n=1 Tax=Tribolium castaneum TaxID=7070 RepID=D7EJP4_TRICA|nr:hypothetical protein TcasGA2_TC001870 [Tribolium castaneum]
MRVGFLASKKRHGFWKLFYRDSHRNSVHRHRKMKYLYRMLYADSTHCTSTIPWFSIDIRVCCKSVIVIVRCFGSCGKTRRKTVYRRALINMEIDSSCNNAFT